MNDLRKTHSCPRRLTRGVVRGVAFLMLSLSLAFANVVDEANQAYKAGQHTKALQLVDRHLADNPKDAQARFLKGVILVALGRQNEAITIFSKMTEDFPNLPQPYNNLAVIYAQQKQYDKARDALEQAIRTHPAYATAHENLGDLYSLMASLAYSKALSLNAANAATQTKLAMINELVSKSKVAAPTASPQAAAPTASPQAVAPNARPVVQENPLDDGKRVASDKESAAKEKKPAAAQPVTTPAGESADVGRDVRQEIAAAIDGWLAAWSKKELKEYLACYAPEFVPPRGQSRQAWEAERRQRIDKPGAIKVAREGLTIGFEGTDKATARFRQHYSSTTFKSSTNKTLVLIRRNGRWLILKEQAG